MNTTHPSGHRMSHRTARTGSAFLLAGVMALGCSGRAAAAPVNSLFNPADYPALTNDFTLTSGTVYIDTKNGTNAPTWSNGTTVLYGQVVTNQSGSNVLALFSFGNLALSNAVSCTVTGNLGLVICSTGNITLANTLDLSGGTNVSGAGGLGGPGSEAGVATTSFKSSPPDANHGKGGGSAGQNGYGYGGGFENSGTTCGGGGGFGGIGGYATWSGTTGAGGTNYGNNILTWLFGGSGGAGPAQSGSAGGGGGGAVELIANGILTISSTSTQKLNGGNGSVGSSRCGGGGSGGGLILAANNLIVAGGLQANGGNGASSGNTLGGGGGGGRIVLYANTLATNGMSWSVAGGVKGTGTGTSGGTNGAAGTFRYAGDGITSDPLGGNLTYPFVSVALPPQIASPFVTNVTAASATVLAHLVTDGGALTTVSVFWGTTNGGTTAAAWANTNSFAAGQWIAGSNPSTNLTTLAADQNYYSRFYAVNSAGNSWAPGLNFITGTLGLQVLDATCGVSAADTAVVQVTRPSACTNETLPVYYTTGGNATNNADYLASPASGSLVISNGQTSALLTLTPLAPWNHGAPRNFTVSLLPGPYVTGTANSATCTLGHYVSSLAYSGTSFTESWVNDGSMVNTITVTMPTNSSGGYLDLFSGANGEDFVANGKVTFGGLPPGLTASAIRTATNTVVLALNGNASNYLSSASITNLGVAFLDGAFAGGHSNLVANASRSDLSVTFVSAYYATNWYVSTTGSDTNSGTLASPFATVQKAANMARFAANDVIHVLPGTYTQSNITINVAVTLTGNTRDDTILQAGPAPYAATNSGILSIGTSAMVRNLTLRYANGGSAISGFNYQPNTLIVDGCRLTQNSTGNNGQYDGGAAVLFGQNAGNGFVVIRNSELSGNHANGDGGAVRVLTWGLTISNCTLTGNSASRDCGAVYAGDGATLYDSLFSSNSAGDSTGAIGFGQFSTISGSTFAFNSAATNAGAFSSSQISITLINSTCYSNTAGLAGGAAWFWCNNAATLSAYNSTFYLNSAGTTGGAFWVTAPLNLYSSIVASNTAGVFGPDISLQIGGYMTTATNSLIGNTVGSGYTGYGIPAFLPVGSPNAYGCYVGTNGAACNPLLLPLANNGGPTLTCALQPGSLAIDHGSNPLGLIWDERGMGYARQTGLGVDIGAFEYGSRPPVKGSAIFFR